MTTLQLLDVKVEMNGQLVHVLSLPAELQVDYLISNHFQHFISKECKLWRMENLYFVMNKSQQRVLFKFNKAQKDFVENYLNKGYKKIIILKSRQLGFTTLISLWFLDDIIFNPNSEALQIAHTLKDASEIFNRKISYAIKNLYPVVKAQLEMDQKRSNRVQFSYPDGSVSAISVSNSGRSGTFSQVHISELGKLNRLYPGRAEEIVTGTLPSVPATGTVIIESTAEGASGLFYEMYMSGYKRRHILTAAHTVGEFYPVFYNWQWDTDEIESVVSNGLIPISTMEDCEINWEEYQKENNLTDKEITFYYIKWLNAQRDIDKLNQEYPLNEMEAFISSGSNYFSARKTQEMYEKCDNNYQRYDFINNEIEKSNTGDLWIYDDVRPGRNYVIGADVAEGLMDGDFTVAIVLGYDKQIKALYRGHIEPDEFANLLKVLGKRFNNALLAVEFNKDGNWVNTELRNTNYPNLYVRTVIDDLTKEPTKMYGWITNKKNRDFMLGEAKKHFNSTEMINCKPLLEEIMVFIRNKMGKPQAASGKHDDIVISWAIAIAVLQGREEKIEVQKQFGILNAIFVN